MSAPRWWPGLRNLGLRLATAGALVVAFAFLIASGVVYARIRPAPAPIVGDVRLLVLYGVALSLALLPLLASRSRVIGGWLASSSIALAIGAYGWSRIDWGHVISGGDFAPGGTPPALILALAAAPFAIIVLYHAASRVAGVGDDLRERGALEEDVRGARNAAAGAVASAVGVAGALWVGLLGVLLLGMPALREAVSAARGPIALAAMAAAAVVVVATFHLRARRRARESTGGSPPPPGQQEDAKVQDSTVESANGSRGSPSSSPMRTNADA